MPRSRFPMVQRDLRRSVAALALVSGLALSLPAPVRATARDPDNRLEASRIWRGFSGATVPAGEEAALVLDGQPATGITLERGEALEFAFVGAPRWLSRITLHTDAIVWRVDIRRLDGSWVTYAVGSAADVDVPVTQDAGAVQALGVRFVAGASAGDAQGRVRLGDIAARFVYSDPDNAGRAAAGDTYHADWVNHYSGDTNDLSKCDDDARDLRDALQTRSWTTFEHTETNARETHFKTPLLGTGDNDSHADNVDFAYYSGHGSSGTVDPVYTGTALGSMLFDDETHDDATLVPSDMDDEWGENDMEWLVSTSCRTLRGEGRPYWKWGMEGVHMICGSESSIADRSYGEVLGDELIDNGIFDSPVTVKQAWFDAMEECNGGHDVAVVEAENSTMGSDYIWGEGAVNNDPTVDNTYTTWLFDVGANAPSRRGAAPMAPLLHDPVTFTSPRRGAWTVRIDRALLERPFATQMPVWNVVPRMVDSFYVRMLAQHVCSTYGLLCGGTIGPGAPGEQTLIQGPIELRVRQETGGFSLTDVANWMAPRVNAPQLLTGQAALTQADQILTQLGFKPSDATASAVSYLWQRAESSTGPGSLASGDSSFAVATKVAFTRRVGSGEGYPVFGPGASISVSMGGNGSLQRIFGRAWRPLSQGAEASIVPLGSLLPPLAALGNGAILDPTRQPIDSLVVTSWELGYFEPACREDVTTLRPVYRLHCICYDGAFAFTSDITMYADALPLDASILSPQEGLRVPPNSTVCFTGDVNGGTPPYAAEWRRDDGTVFGSGSSACAVLQMPSDPHSGGDSTRTVTLHVTDSRGAEAEAKIHVALVTVTAIGDANGAPSGEGFQSVPAILGDRATIAFRLAPSALSGPVRVSLVDATGRVVRTLFDGTPAHATTTLAWSRTDNAGHQTPSGVYSLVLDAPGLRQARKVVVMR